MGGGKDGWINLSFFVMVITQQIFFWSCWCWQDLGADLSEQDLGSSPELPLEQLSVYLQCITVFLTWVPLFLKRHGKALAL